VKHFLRPHAQVSITPGAIVLLGRSSFSGNVRELEHRVSSFAELASLIDEDLVAKHWASTTPPTPAESGREEKARLEANARHQATQALSNAKGDHARAAESLGVSRRRLSYLLDEPSQAM
jgi:transcriptional regulator with PAS, ATPase and Fis domain